MDLNKSLEWFDPTVVDKSITIIGCGAVGSHTCVLLARLGIQSFILYDKDTVDSHNIANQNFNFNDIGRPKVEVVAEQIKAINPQAKVVTVNDFFVPFKHNLNGYVVFCVDSIDVRREITKYCQTLSWVKGIFDFRMGLTSGQFYAVTPTQYKEYLNTMQFTNEEADALTPHSACGFELSVAYSIWTMLGIGISLMVRTWKGESVPMTNIIDTGNLTILSC